MHGGNSLSEQLTPRESTLRWCATHDFARHISNIDDIDVVVNFDMPKDMNSYSKNRFGLSTRTGKKPHLFSCSLLDRRCKLKWYFNFS